ncbi:MAG: glycosyltransferase family 2 protein, partial [Patescibacteria group bacterium]
QKLGFTQFCVMNYDTFFKENFVESILESFMNHPGSVIGGKIYYAAGYEYHNDRYSKDELGKVIWYAGGTVLWDHAFTPHTGVDEVDKGQFDNENEVEFITGCLMCFDETVIKKVGLWDPDYFLYYEDADFSVRASRAGIKLIYDPSIVLWHKVSQTTEGSGSAFHQKYQEKNRVKFGLKYAPLRTKFHLVKNLFLTKK